MIGVLVKANFFKGKKPLNVLNTYGFPTESGLASSPLLFTLNLCWKRALGNCGVRFSYARSLSRNQPNSVEDLKEITRRV